VPDTLYLVSYSIRFIDLVEKDVSFAKLWLAQDTNVLRMNSENRFLELLIYIGTDDFVLYRSATFVEKRFKLTKKSFSDN